MSEREPDLDDDPRKQGTGQGYPESNPADQTPQRETLIAEEAATLASCDVCFRRAAQRFAAQVSLFDLVFALLTIHVFTPPLDYK